jgi:hypothetical protein
MNRRKHTKHQKQQQVLFFLIGATFKKTTGKDQQNNSAFRLKIPS